MNKNSRKIICLFLALILCLGLWVPVTAQEAAHTFGLDDMYNNPDHPNPPANAMGCIMDSYNASLLENFYNRVKTGEISAFCPYCCALIRDLAQTKTHPGNQ